MKLDTRADASLIGDLLYSYNALGHRVGIAGSLAATTLPAAMNSAVYDSANRVTNWNGIGITYDANGNMLSDGVRTYTWDAKNRLSAISGGATASFQYDAYGRRLSKTVSGAATSYLYDGANPVQELTGTTPSANILTGLGIDEFYRRTDASGSRDMLTDALGSIIALTDSLAQIKTQYSYEPYGATTTTGEANTNPFQYTGRENDGTGVYYYRARYYNPAFGRFVSSDPIGFAGGINTYAYVENDPLSSTDPLGLRKIGKDVVDALGDLLDTKLCELWPAGCLFKCVRWECTSIGGCDRKTSHNIGKGEPYMANPGYNPNDDKDCVCADYKFNRK